MRDKRTAQSSVFEGFASHEIGRELHAAILRHPRSVLNVGRPRSHARAVQEPVDSQLPET